jgi:hypothetical protein
LGESPLHLHHHPAPTTATQPTDHLLTDIRGTDIRDMNLTRFRGAPQAFNGGFSDGQDAPALFT